MKFFFSIFFVLIKNILNQDPFLALGIPNFNPSQIFDWNKGINQSNEITDLKDIPKIKTVDDLQKYLKRGNFDETQGLTIISKFLIADDYFLKKNGVVFDLTGLDGLNQSEIVFSYGTKERLLQRAKSAAKIYV